MRYLKNWLISTVTNMCIQSTYGQTLFICNLAFAYIVEKVWVILWQITSNMLVLNVVEIFQQDETMYMQCSICNVEFQSDKSMFSYYFVFQNDYKRGGDLSNSSHLIHIGTPVQFVPIHEGNV